MTKGGAKTIYRTRQMWYQSRNVIIAIAAAAMVLGIATIWLIVYGLTTRTAISIKPGASMMLYVFDTNWRPCQRYPIDYTIEFKIDRSEWRDARLKSGKLGSADVDVKIWLVGDGIDSPLLIHEKTFSSGISNSGARPLLDGWIEVDRSIEYYVHEYTYGFEFHPHEGITPSGFDYRFQCELEIHGTIDGQPIDLTIPQACYGPPISIKS